MRKHFKKIVISIMLVLTVNFITPPASHAWDVGGILIKPFSAFAAGILDIANGWMTYFIVGISNGFIVWANMTIDEISDAMSDESTYSNYNSLVRSDPIGANVDIVATNLASVLVSMEDFFVGAINLANINIFKDLPDQSVFSHINQFIRNVNSRKYVNG